MIIWVETFKNIVLKRTLGIESEMYRGGLYKGSITTDGLKARSINFLRLA